MKIAVISCSLNPESRSRVLARAAESRLKAAGVEVDFVDLQALTLPMAGKRQDWSRPEVEALRARLDAVQGFVLAVPIYTYDVNAAAKNLVELCGKAFEGKVAGFLCSAGGTASYMSVMAFANSLMLDFRTYIVPRFVYAVREAVAGGKIVDADIAARVEQLADEVARVAGALN
jgi:FMN reductase